MALLLSDKDTVSGTGRFPSEYSTGNVSSSSRKEHGTLSSFVTIMEKDQVSVGHLCVVNGYSIIAYWHRVFLASLGRFSSISVIH